MTQTIGDPAQLAIVPEGWQAVLPPAREKEEMLTVGVGGALRRNSSPQENETVKFLLTHGSTYFYQFRLLIVIALQEKIRAFELTTPFATRWYTVVVRATLRVDGAVLKYNGMMQRAVMWSTTGA